ncbi:DUF4123 domain-containing protein [Burkholderia sp. NLJ2]|uniref:DUF4123 domain-containing protein n=1 Tax=Burkholderia sp. NLJ2 TaxID=3090699 RepID=UPI003C6C82AF
MGLRTWLAERGIAPATVAVNAFCLTEMSGHPDLRARLEFHGVPYRSLWQTGAHSALEQHAPCLFRSDAESAFDQWLGSTLGTLPLTVLFTRLPADHMAAHLRRFTKFHDDEGRYFLRLGDPASLRLYLDAVSHDPAVVARLFGQRGMEALYVHDTRIALSRHVQPLFEQGWDSTGREGYLVWQEIDAQQETT